MVSNAQGTLTYKVKTNGTTTASTLSGSKLTAGAMSTENDNNQTVVVTITAGGNTNYNSGSKDVTITVQKYTPTLAWASATPSSIVYGTTGKTATITATVSGGTKGAITYASGTTSVLTINASTGALTTKGVGSSVITANIARTTTVKAGSTTKTISVTKATNPITVTANKLTYNGKAQNLVTTSNAQGAVYYSVGTALTSSNYSTAGSTTIPTRTDADMENGYVVYYYCVGNSNYNAKSGNVTVTIEKAEPTITLKDKTVNYTGKNISIDAPTVTGVEGGSSPSGDITYTYYTDSGLTTKTPTSTGAMEVGGAPKNAGTYYVTATIDHRGNYYSRTSSAVKLVINKVTLTVTAVNKTMTYGGTVPTYTYTATGYVNSETANVLSGTVKYTVKNSSGTVVTVSSTTSAGTYTITPSGLSATNYNITYKAGTLTINKATTTMKVSDASKIIEDGSSSTFTYTYGGDGAVTVKSSDTSIATCSVNTSTKTVTVNALKTSTKAATITVSAAAGTNYNATSKTVQIGAIVISGVPTSWTNKDQKVTAKTTLTGHTVQTMKDTGSWQTASSQTFTANGTFSARVLNSSGTKSVTITKIDKTAPTITRTGASVNGYVITASMTATDNSGVTPSYQYNIGGGTFQTSNTFTVTSAGTYTIGFKAIDAAGNESEIQYKKVTVNTAPTTPTTWVKSRNTNTIVVNAKSTDGNGDKLMYKLYTKVASASSYTLSATSASTASGTAVDLTASNLSSFTVYNYYVTVTDGISTTTGSTVTTGTGCDYTTGVAHTASTCTDGEVRYHSCPGSGCWCGCTDTYNPSNPHNHGVPYGCKLHNIPQTHYYCDTHGNTNLSTNSCPGYGIHTATECSGKVSKTCNNTTKIETTCGGTLEVSSNDGKTFSWRCTVCGSIDSRGTPSTSNPAGIPHDRAIVKYKCDTHDYLGTSASHVYWVSCEHGLTGTHYYCTTHGYVGTSNYHSYCSHGKAGMHFPN